MRANLVSRLSTGTEASPTLRSLSFMSSRIPLEPPSSLKASMELMDHGLLQSLMKTLSTLLTALLLTSADSTRSPTRMRSST
jgi:hypothetical protein